MKLLNSLNTWLATLTPLSLQQQLLDVPAASENNQTQLAAWHITEQQIQTLQNTLAQQLQHQLQEQTLLEALAPWQKLFENFRIGAQLGLQNFHDTVIESGEALPAAQKDQLDIFEASSWERIAVQLLQRFDQTIYHDMQQAVQTPAAFIQRDAIIYWLQHYHQNDQLSGTALLEKILTVSQQKIISICKNLRTHFIMPDTLEKLMSNPGAIAVELETYLWARYIQAKRIGDYPGKLQSLLQITPRIAPRASIAKRLTDLRVIETQTLLEGQTRQTQDTHLKKLNEWAHTQTNRLSLWEAIRVDTHNQK